jgi:hypothetical protein
VRVPAARDNLKDVMKFRPGSVANGAVVVGCVLFGFAVSAGPGLVARAAEPDRWRDRLLSQLSSAEQHRMADPAPASPEAERSAAPSRMGSAPAASSERDALLAQNEALARQNRVLLLENRNLVDAQARAAGTCARPDGEDAKAQLMYWAERVRNDGQGLRGGLSSTQSAALGVLLRPTRPLDPDNPWH